MSQQVWLSQVWLSQLQGLQRQLLVSGVAVDLHHLEASELLQLLHHLTWLALQQLPLELELLQQMVEQLREPLQQLPEMLELQ